MRTLNKRQDRATALFRVQSIIGITRLVKGVLMSAQNNLYPALYHSHHKNVTEDLPFWRTLARWQGDPVLELGCGTGRVLLPLAQDGRIVYGIDNSPAMLSFLQQRIPDGLHSKIHLREADITNFQFKTRFRLVFLPCNTYSAFDTPGRAAILEHSFQHLQPGGVFAISTPNPNLLQALQTNEDAEIETIFTHPETGNPVQVSNNWVREDEVIRMNWHYDHIYPDGKVERLTASTRHYLSTMETYITEFIAAGFTIQATYRNFETGKYKPDASHLIIVAKK
ncbi:MAG TPA: class I SAM-dependent methyltransferase [Anaerolineales bacterium]|nr:class I SAM-dependent methyltransferase [Anaerolineales bacterium]